MSIFDTRISGKEMNERKVPDKVRPLRKRLPLPFEFQPNISVDEAISSLRRVFETAYERNDMATVETLHRTAAALMREFPIVGRPSGSSPPQPLELPDQPPAWWRDREPGTTPDKWIETYYKKYIPAGLTRSFFQRKGQDKAFYNALLAWEQQPQSGIPDAPNNQLRPDLYIPTKSELLDRQLEEMGGIAATPGQRLSPAEIRQAARLYKAGLRYG